MNMPKPDVKLCELIAEERRLFALDEGEEGSFGQDDASFDDHADRIHALRSAVAMYPAHSIADVMAKAEHVKRIFADNGEMLGSIVAKCGSDDYGLAIAVVHDLLKIMDMMI